MREHARLLFRGREQAERGGLDEADPAEQALRIGIGEVVVQLGDRGAHRSELVESVVQHRQAATAANRIAS